MKKGLKMALLFAVSCVCVNLCGCGTQFERKVSNNVAATDFWNHFYEYSLADSVAEYLHTGDMYEWNRGDVAVLARGSDQNDYEFSEEFFGLEECESLIETLKENPKDWVMVKASADDGYTACDIWAIMAYDKDSNNQYSLWDIEIYDTICSPIQPYEALDYEKKIMEYLNDNGIKTDSLAALVEQPDYETGARELAYDYDIFYRNITGTIHIYFDWQEETGEFEPFSYEFSEEMVALLPPEGALMAEECKKDTAYLLRDGYFYPLDSLEAEGYLYDSSGNEEEYVCAITPEGGYYYYGSLYRIPIMEGDQFVTYKDDVSWLGLPDLYFRKIEIPDEEKYICLDSIAAEMFDWGAVFHKDGRAYTVTEVNGAEVDGESWRKENLLAGHYFVGSKNDKIVVGGYRGTEYAEIELVPEYRMLDLSSEKISCSLELTKNGYGVYDISELGPGMYIELDSKCVFYFQ